MRKKNLFFFDKKIPGPAGACTQREISSTFGLVGVRATSCFVERFHDLLALCRIDGVGFSGRMGPNKNNPNHARKLLLGLVGGDTLVVQAPTEKNNNQCLF